MQTFLECVAQDLYKKLGNDLSHTALVFPNKRAGLFFNEYLAQQADHPLWSPAYVSISELFQQLSELKLGDSIRLVCELYQVFKEETRSQETLDEFYFWGELLISDFDDVDKNLVDADRLFSNLQDLKDIADIPDYLSPEQEDAIHQFFSNFSIAQRTELKEKFISLWDRLGAIYHRYRQRLLELGIAYEGMLYREVYNQLDPDRLDYERFVFVGFNVLNKVETGFFRRLQEAGRAMFYWDYDQFYTNLPREVHSPAYAHEAGEFIVRNLQLFPNQLPDSYFDQLGKEKQVCYISAATENAQARYVMQWARDVMTASAAIGGTPVREKENAIVLCNEALLLPVLHALPKEVRHVNVTMGFPLTQTPAYSFLNALLQLQTEGYRADSGRYLSASVMAVLKHPYVERLSATAENLQRRLVRDNRFYPLPSELKTDAFLDKLFTHPEGLMELAQYLAGLLREVSVLYRNDNAEEGGEGSEKTGQDDLYNQLYRESLFKSYTVVNRLASLIASGELRNVQVHTFRRLLDRILAGTHIPFHGEPAIGLQVMGVLETRNLDFRNLLMLSVNEGQLPKAEGDSSFIPYNLRKAFGMTTIEHKNAVYAYYFYRLIQRAEHITLLYNTSSDGLNRGEMSRFMLQFLVEWPHPVRRLFLEAGQSPLPIPHISIDKTPEIMQRLLRYDVSRHPRSFFSPSALNAYLDCRLKFYFRYIAGLKAPDETSAEIDSALFGTIFHRAAEMLYRDLTAHGCEVSKDDLDALLKNEPKLQSYVNEAFNEKFFHVAPHERPEYNGTQLIHARVIGTYLRQLLRNDLAYAPFAMVAMEETVSEVWEVQTAEGAVFVHIGGTIDRMDRKDDTLRIVDYKTGGAPKPLKSVEQLFVPAKDRPGYIFQTFLYAAILSRKQPLKVAPSLLYIHRAASEGYSPVIYLKPSRQPEVPVDNFAQIEDEFRERLQSLLNEMFDSEEPFTQTPFVERCAYCDYRGLCKRG